MATQDLLASHFFLPNFIAMHRRRSGAGVNPSHDVFALLIGKGNFLLVADYSLFSNSVHRETFSFGVANVFISIADSERIAIEFNDPLSSQQN